ncbi:MAG: SprT family zinc-dependent metalloprotease [Pseudomonadota bacterium]
MTTLALSDGSEITITLRRNARARRLTLRVSAQDGRVTLTVPPGVSARAALDFARSRRDWLDTQLSKFGPAHALALGDTVPVDGTDRQLALGSGRVPTLDGAELLLPRRAAAAPGQAVAGFLKLHARDALTAASDRYAAALGRSFTRISLRDTRSRWGSCSSAGALMYSWRLAMAPPAVQDYVAAHEVAHLAEMNHSPAFWAVVGELMPDYAEHRAWLRTHGGTLQRIKLD